MFVDRTPNAGRGLEVTEEEALEVEKCCHSRVIHSRVMRGDEGGWERRRSERRRGEEGRMDGWLAEGRVQIENEGRVCVHACALTCLRLCACVYDSSSSIQWIGGL